MTRVLFVLSYPAELRRLYAQGLQSAFPEIEVAVVADRVQAEQTVREADVLLTFAPMVSKEVLAAGVKLKWVQVLGTGVDGVADCPTLRPDVLVTNVSGIHGAPMSEAALSAMLALSRDLPRSVRCQDRREWERWPASLLHRKTLGILGVGAIATELAPRAKALGMTVVGIS